MVGAGGAPASDAPTAHYADLDGLRGLLALAVAVFHLGFNSFTMRTFGWSGLRFDLAVDVFFVLSGFVLTRATRTRPGVFAFAIKRAFRLIPVYYFSALITVLALSRWPEPLEFVMLVPITGHMPVNFPAWSISWEFYLPVLAVALWIRTPKPLVRPLLAVAVVLLGLADWAQELGWDMFFPRAALGLFAGHLLDRSRLELDVPLELPTMAIFAIMAAAAWRPEWAILLPFVACAAVLAGRAGGSLLGSSPARFLGTISYPLYMLHVPLLFVVQAIFDGVDRNATAKLVVLAVTLVAATATTWLVERPAMRFGARLARRLTVQPPLGAEGASH